MSEEIDHDRRRFLATVAMTFAAAQFGMIGSPEAQTSKAATSTAGFPPAPRAKFVASTEKTFDQLIAEAMSVMHRDMHNAGYSGEPDRDFVTMMIPHHQGAIDMAKAELLYGKDPVLRRLAQEIIVTQEQEIEAMRMRLKQFKTQ